MFKSTTTKGTMIPAGTTPDGKLRGVFVEEAQPGGEIKGALVEVTPVPDGKPIMGDYVTMTAREGSPLYDAEITAFERPAGSGPAKVNSNAYRSG